MRALYWLPTVVFLAGCSKPAPAPAPEARKATAPVKITQFYATAPHLTPGSHELLCYGVENAKAVWLSPPRKELSAALTRCVEVSPTGTTTYTLTAEGATGDRATSELTVTLGKAPPARAHIVEVKISAKSVTRGDAVSICFRVEHAQLVEIQPIRFRAVAKNEGCVMDTPQQTTTYVVSAVGADGERDQERVTIAVRPRA